MLRDAGAEVETGNRVHGEPAGHSVPDVWRVHPGELHPARRGGGARPVQRRAVPRRRAGDRRPGDDRGLAASGPRSPRRRSWTCSPGWAPRARRPTAGCRSPARARSAASPPTWATSASRPGADRAGRAGGLAVGVHRHRAHAHARDATGWPRWPARSAGSAGTSPSARTAWRSGPGRCTADGSLRQPRRPPAGHGRRGARAGRARRPAGRQRRDRGQDLPRLHRRLWSAMLERAPEPAEPATPASTRTMCGSARARAPGRAPGAARPRGRGRGLRGRRRPRPVPLRGRRPEPGRRSPR